ncbi:MAG: TlpA family protein disulfide reductase [Parasporobacterium sp.]|nr:TlpA family protein disulfide reductase [Parasporobacterium sp.]
MKFKIIISTFLISLLLCSTAYAGSRFAEEYKTPFYSSPSEVTFEDIEAASVIDNILAVNGSFKIITAPAAQEGEEPYYTSTLNYALTDGLRECTDDVTYPDGESASIYYSDDEENPVLYSVYDGVIEAFQIYRENVLNEFASSLLLADGLKGTIDSITEKDGNYIADISLSENDVPVLKETVTIDPESGFITEIIINAQDEDGIFTVIYTYRLIYDEDVHINRDVVEEFRNSGGEIIYLEEYADADTAEDAPEGTLPVDSALSFTTTDINGNGVTEDIMKDARLVMINFWEPWCGPCVGEMPDLQKLYENYKDKGLLILGVFGTAGSDAEAIAEDAGTTYPLLNSTDDFDIYRSAYVPTTVFLDSNGMMISEDAQYIGARSYEEWETLILEYLDR